MNDNLLKFFAIFGFIILIIGILFVVKVQYDQNLEQKAITSSLIEMKKMQDEVLRSKNQFVSKEQFDKLSKNLDFNFKQIEEDLKSFNAEPRAIETIRIISTGQTLTQQPTSIGEESNPNSKIEDIFGYLKNEQIFSINEKIGSVYIPFAKIKFKGWEQSPWGANIYSRQYNLNTVLGQDEEGRYYTYSNFSVETGGKKYVIPITEAKIEQKIPEKKWKFNPRLFLGMSGGAIVNKEDGIKPEIAPNISLGFSSIGHTKTNPEWIIGMFGVGYQAVDNEFTFLISPGGYNIGYQLPLIDNLIIMPSASMNFKGEAGVYFGIHAGL